LTIRDALGGPSVVVLDGASQQVLRHCSNGTGHHVAAFMDSTCGEVVWPSCLFCLYLLFAVGKSVGLMKTFTVIAVRKVTPVRLSPAEPHSEHTEILLPFLEGWRYSFQRSDGLLVNATHCLRSFEHGGYKFGPHLCLDVQSPAVLVDRRMY